MNSKFVQKDTQKDIADKDSTITWIKDPKVVNDPTNEDEFAEYLPLVLDWKINVTNNVSIGDNDSIENLNNKSFLIDDPMLC